MLQTIYHIIYRDLFLLRLRSLNQFLDSIGMDKLASTYDIDLKAVKGHLEQLADDKDCAMEPLDEESADDDDNHLMDIAKRYYANVKRRTRDTAPKDFKFVDVSIEVTSILIFLILTHFCDAKRSESSSVTCALIRSRPSLDLITISNIAGMFTRYVIFLLLSWSYVARIPTHLHGLGPCVYYSSSSMLYTHTPLTIHFI